MGVLHLSLKQNTSVTTQFLDLLYKWERLHFQVVSPCVGTLKTSNPRKTVDWMVGTVPNEVAHIPIPMAYISAHYAAEQRGINHKLKKKAQTPRCGK
jgi:hypothetical protein